MLLTSGRHPATGRARRWIATVVIVSAVVLLPWIGYLAVSLPPSASARHWPVVWAGLDAAEAAGLAATGWLALRRDRRAAFCAASTATMLVLDAWFDVCTSAAGQSYAFALIDVVIEVAEAAACLVVGWLVWCNR
ncbi:MAG: hypothetical protein ABSA93_14145 [Streptosporangiaceae bacterium]|jgi:hypothetical protein